MKHKEIWSKITCVVIIIAFGIMMSVFTNVYALFGDTDITSPKSVGFDGKELAAIHILNQENIPYSFLYG